jgi:hypothetical protein
MVGPGTDWGKVACTVTDVCPNKVFGGVGAYTVTELFVIAGESYIFMD